MRIRREKSIPAYAIKNSPSRNLQFAAFSLAGLAIYSTVLQDIAVFSWNSGTFSYILLIPFISSWLIHSRKRQIFSSADYSLPTGTPIVAAALLLLFVGKKNQVFLNQNDYLALVSISGITFWIGGFISIYGLKAFRRAAFPFFFLLFMAPLPSVLLEGTISILQKGSTETAYGIFKLTGVPFSRDGFVFHLPGLDIAVAKGCSGIRSSLILFIMSLLIGNLLLKKPTNRVLLALCSFPIAVFKNGLRIVTLSLLAVYVDEDILSSVAHTRGGYPFFLLALSLLGLVVWYMRSSERKATPFHNRDRRIGV